MMIWLFQISIYNKHTLKLFSSRSIIFLWNTSSYTSALIILTKIWNHVVESFFHLIYVSVHLETQQMGIFIILFEEHHLVCSSMYSNMMSRTQIYSQKAHDQSIRHSFQIKKTYSNFRMIFQKVFCFSF